MSALQQQAEHLWQLSQQLHKLYAQACADRDRLQQELERRSASEIEWKQKVKTLEEQLLIARASAGEADLAARKEFEQKINFYIREIDKCIAVLNE